MALGLKPGPKFGETLEAVETRQLEEMLRTREEALEWVKREYSRQALRQSAARVRLDDRNVRGVNGAAGIHVGAEVRAVNCLATSRLCLADVGRVDNAAGGGITKQKAHLDRNITGRSAGTDAQESDGDGLDISHTSKIYGRLVCATAARAGNAASSGSQRCAA